MCKDKPKVIEPEEFATSSSAAIRRTIKILNALVGSSLAREKYVTETLVWVAIITSPDTFEQMFPHTSRDTFLALHDVKSIVTRVENEINLTSLVDSNVEVHVDLSHIKDTLFTSEALILICYLFQEVEGNVKVNINLVNQLSQHCAGGNVYCDMPVTQSVMSLYNYSLRSKFGA